MSLIEELNVQAALEANRGGEELVRDSLVERQLLPVLVHELLSTELWRAEVLPRILSRGKPESSFQVPQPSIRGSTNFSRQGETLRHIIQGGCGAVAQLVECPSKCPVSRCNSSEGSLNPRRGIRW